MKDFHLHSIIVEYRTLFMLSADTGFYDYIGHERIYESFLQLLDEDSRANLLCAIEKKSAEPFVIRLYNDKGEIEQTYIRISYEIQHMTFELEAIPELIEAQELYRKLYGMNQDLLGLHNDIVFSFDKKNQNVRLYTPDFRRCTKSYTLQEFIEEVRANMVKEEYGKLDEMVNSLTIESGSFAHTFTGNIIKGDEDCKSSIVKGVAVKNMESMDIIGYIHRGTNKGNATNVVEKDALTDTYSKREIDNIVRKTIDSDKQPNIALCIIDLDYFKKVNDNFGHLMGDEVLKEVANIIKSEVGDSGVVGRFGGDEFLVMFYDVEDMELCRGKLSSIKNRVNFKYPPSEDNSTVEMSLSIGCAVYPKDADNYTDIFNLADYCLYRAKDRGRNRYIIYSKELLGTLETIREQYNNRRIESRKDAAMGDVLCMIEDLHYNDAQYTSELLVDDLVENLPFESIVCFSGSPLECRYMSGINLPSIKTLNECAKLIGKADCDFAFQEDILMADNIDSLKVVDENIYNACVLMKIKAVILVRFKDLAGKPSVVALQMSTNPYAWNRSQLYNYRKIARMFGRYEL